MKNGWQGKNNNKKYYLKKYVYNLFNLHQQPFLEIPLKKKLQWISCTTTAWLHSLCEVAYESRLLVLFSFIFTIIHSARNLLNICFKIYLYNLNLELIHLKYKIFVTKQLKLCQPDTHNPNLSFDLPIGKPLACDVHGPGQCGECLLFLWIKLGNTRQTGIIVGVTYP